MVSERQAVRGRLTEAQEALRGPDEFLRDRLARAQGAIAAAADRNRRATQAAQGKAPSIVADGRPERYDAWASPRWEGWESEPAPPGEIRVGEARLSSGTLLPATVPLFAGRTIVVVTESEAAAHRAHALMRALAVRVSLALGPLGTLHLLDPAQEGFGFPERDRLANAAPFAPSPSTALNAVIEAAHRRRAEPDGRVDVVVGLDFPTRFDYSAVEALNRTARLAEAGVQLIVHHDLTRDMGAGRGPGLDLTDPVVIGVDERGIARHAWGALAAIVDDAAPRRLLDELAARIPRPEAPRSPDAQFEDLHPTSPARWWRESATDLVSVPIAPAHGGTIDVMFGQEPGGITHTHAVVGGTTGSGKSELLHAIITGIATRYSPDDVQLYLVDGHSGVSFQRYRDLPHATLVSLNTPVDLARAVLVDLESEFRRREGILTGSGAQSLAEVRRQGAKGMPRLIVIVDEYQRFFEGDRRDDTAGVLQRIAAQGRKVGIHLLLASQRFHATGLLNQEALFNNISTRIGLKLPPDSIGSVDEFAKEGRDLLRSCTRPGDVVVNQHGGADGHNQVGRVAWLGSEPPVAILDALANASPLRPEVIDGKASPQPRDNLALGTLTTLHPTTPKAIRDWAESAPRDGGLGVNSWQPYDQPLPFVLGRTFTAHGSAVAKVDRAAEHNVALVVGEAAALHGMLVTGLVSAGLSVPAGRLEVWTLRQLPGPGEPWERALTADLESVLPRHRVRHAADAVALLDEATAELERREGLDAAAQAECATLILAATGLDRVAGFRTVEGRYGVDASPATQALLEVAKRGPFVGIHVVVGFASAPQWSQVMPPKAARQFVHRVVSQLSEEHSRLIVDDSFATKVMPAGTDGPQRCGYSNRDTLESTVFLPYRYDQVARAQLEGLTQRRTDGV